MVLWSDLKKSAKSAIAAAVELYLAWHHPWETVRVVGNDLKQANSRTFFYIERAIKLNPRLKAVCNTKLYKIMLPNNTTIEAIPVDPDGEAGGGDLIVCFTELWAAKNEASKRLWTETTLSPLKYGKSLRWAESYAGFMGASPILEQLYEAGVNNGRVVDIGIDGLELYTNDAARMLCLWNTQPRCHWQTPEYYAQEAATLTESEFARVHGNAWQTGSEAFVPPEWWDACQGDIPPIGQYQPVVVGIDAGTTNDCFGIVAVSRIGETVHVRHVRKWVPPKGGKLDFAGPEEFIRWLAANYNVVAFVYDPWQLHDLATRLRRDGVGHFKEFPQNGPRAIADKQLYDLIRDKSIVHDGNADLAEHIKNANRKDEAADKLRIVKRAEKAKVDLAVALSMCAYEAKRLLIG
jgi:phage terminase large subunit-like protein